MCAHLAEHVGQLVPSLVSGIAAHTFLTSYHLHEQGPDSVPLLRASWHAEHAQDFVVRLAAAQGIDVLVAGRLLLLHFPLFPRVGQCKHFLELRGVEVCAGVACQAVGVEFLLRVVHDLLRPSLLHGEQQAEHVVSPVLL